MMTSLSFWTFNTEIKEIADVTLNGADELEIGEEDM